MQVQAYLDFDGRCEEALEFYKRAIGAEVTTVMRFKDNPDAGDAGAGGEGCPGPEMPPGFETKIMHSEMKIGDSVVMASDCHCSGNTEFRGISLTLNPATEEEATKLFNALAEGGNVFMPPAKTFFAKMFCVVADKFGVSWMIVVAP